MTITMAQTRLALRSLVEATGYFEGGVMGSEPTSPPPDHSAAVIFIRSRGRGVTSHGMVRRSYLIRCYAVRFQDDDDAERFGDAAEDAIRGALAADFDLSDSGGAETGVREVFHEGIETDAVNETIGTGERGTSYLIRDILVPLDVDLDVTFAK